MIHSAWQNGCKKLEFLGSSCIYPRMAPQPMKENCLLTSELEKTNEAYALAKISGLKYCEFLNRQYGTDYIIDIQEAEEGFPFADCGRVSGRITNLPDIVDGHHHLLVANELPERLSVYEFEEG